MSPHSSNNKFFSQILMSAFMAISQSSEKKLGPLEKRGRFFIFGGRIETTKMSKDVRLG